MSHEILADCYYGYRIPAWHEISRPGLIPMEAVKVLEQIGEPKVTVEPLFYTIDTDVHPSDHLAIVRHPFRKEGWLDLGIVKPGYKLLTPYEVCLAWDAQVKQHVETMAHLYDGGRFVLSSFLPEFNVQKDLIKPYLLADIDLMGGLSYIRNVNERVVCANTLAVAQNETQVSFKIDHYESPHEQIRSILTGIYETQEVKLDQEQAIYTSMAEAELDQEQVEQVIQAAFAIAPQPLAASPGDDAYDRWDKHKHLMQEWQAATRVVFNGEGRGLATLPSTAWKAWQAVVETVDFGGNPGKPQQRYRSVISGVAATKKQRAYDMARELIGV